MDDVTITGSEGRADDRSVHDRDRRIAQLVEGEMRKRLEADGVEMRRSQARYADGEHVRGPCCMVRLTLIDGDDVTTREVVVPDSALERNTEREAVAKIVDACCREWVEFEQRNGGAPDIGDREFESVGGAMDDMWGAGGSGGGDHPDHPGPGANIGGDESEGVEGESTGSDIE